MAAFLIAMEGSVTIISISGRLEPAGGRDLREALDRLAETSGSLLVDLEGLDYMASAGFRELFLVGRKLGRRGARLAVCGLRGEVRRVFELARFDTAYPVFSDRPEALSVLMPDTCPHIEELPTHADWEEIQAHLEAGLVWDMAQSWFPAAEEAFRPASVRIGHSNDRLHVLATLTDEEIHTDATERNQPLWTLGDVFEVFAGVQGNPGYIEYHVAPNGCALQLLFPAADSLQKAAKAGLTPLMRTDDATLLRATRTSEGWMAYAGIPASSLPGSHAPLSGQVWDLSLCRYDFSPSTGKAALASTSPFSQPSFHRRHEWRTIRMA